MKLSVFYRHAVDAAIQTGKTLQEILRTIREFGIEAVEICPDDVEEVSEFHKNLKNAGLAISSVYQFFDFNKNEEDNDARAKRQLELAEKLKSPFVMAVPGFYVGKDKDTEREKMIAGCKQWAERSVLRGLTPTVEDFDSVESPLCRVENIREFLEKIPNLRFTFDTGNFIFSGMNVNEGLKCLQNKTVHIHCKDRKIVNGDYLPCAVGEGDLRLDRVLGHFEEAGYSGYYVIEHFGVKDYLKAIESSVRFIQDIKNNFKIVSE